MKKSASILFRFCSKKEPFFIMILILMALITNCNSSQKEQKENSIVKPSSQKNIASSDSLKIVQRLDEIQQELENDYRSCNLFNSNEWLNAAQLFEKEVSSSAHTPIEYADDLQEIFISYQKARLAILNLQQSPEEFINYSLDNYDLFISKLKQKIGDDSLKQWLKQNQKNHGYYRMKYVLKEKLKSKLGQANNEILFMSVSNKANRAQIPPFAEMEVEYLNRPWYTYYLMGNLTDTSKWEFAAQQFYDEVLLACPVSAYDEQSIKTHFFVFQKNRAQIHATISDKTERNKAIQEAISQFRLDLQKTLTLEDYLVWGPLRHYNFEFKNKQYAQWKRSKKQQ